MAVDPRADLCMNSQLVVDIIEHHLGLFGIAAECLTGPESTVKLLSMPDADAVDKVRRWMATGSVVVALKPSQEFLAKWHIERLGSLAGPRRLKYTPDPVLAWSDLKTLHEADIFRHVNGHAIVVDDEGSTIWLWLPLQSGGLLVVGTELAGDLIRYRQGDPAQVSARQTEPVWGMPGERPNYLFEAQLEGVDLRARPADAWCMALVDVLKSRAHVRGQTILPEGAPGAVVITGDDDQAALGAYAQQLSILDRMPITYFLHYKTNHRLDTLRSMLGKEWIELGLHPDALDAPADYERKLADQVAWFRNLTGRHPKVVRNHGFLNEGYWGHVPSWLQHHIYGSSNLPGFNGRVLNGSLLPARVAFDGVLTDHWSILTVIGDGLRFAGGCSDEEAAQTVFDVADRVRSSRMPGVIVLNLHPENISKTIAMHRAAIDIIRSGFHAWNLGQCLQWFVQRSRSRVSFIEHHPRSPLKRLGDWFQIQTSHLLSDYSLHCTGNKVVFHTTPDLFSQL